jgi:NADH-quinone oxidoreductase subunit E
MLTAEEIKEIEHAIKLVPYKKAASVEALKVVQEHRRWVSDESLRDVAKYLDMSP